MSIKYLRKIQFYISNKEIDLDNMYYIKRIIKFTSRLQNGYLSSSLIIFLSFFFSFKPRCVPHYKKNLKIFFFFKYCVHWSLPHIHINTFFITVSTSGSEEVLNKFNLISKMPISSFLSRKCLGLVFIITFFKAKFLGHVGSTAHSHTLKKTITTCLFARI